MLFWASSKNLLHGSCCSEATAQRTPPIPGTQPRQHTEILNRLPDLMVNPASDEGAEWALLSARPLYLGATMKARLWLLSGARCSAADCDEVRWMRGISA